MGILYNVSTNKISHLKSESEDIIMTDVIREDLIAKSIENYITEKFNKPYRTGLYFTDRYLIAIIYDTKEEREDVERTFCETLAEEFEVIRDDINAVEVHYAV